MIKTKYFHLVLALCVAVTFMSVPKQSYAGSADVGKVLRINSINESLVVLHSSGERSLVPSCAKNMPNWWAIDPSSVSGQVLLDELKKLMQHDKTVRIVGTGDCGVLNKIESISFFYPIESSQMRSVE